MAPRRHGSGHGGGLLESSVFQLAGLHTSSSVVAASQLDLDSLGLNHVLGAAGASLHCCTPGECLRGESPVRAWLPQDSVKVVCNNENCPAGQYMHRECFEAWEQTVLSYLKTCGRARSWSERQRHQNLWTKKGYDLAFKACGCKCGRGHLKKDLDWMSANLGPENNLNHGNSNGNGVSTGTNGSAATNGEALQKKKKRRNRQNSKPSLTVSSGPPGQAPGSHHLQQQQQQQQHHPHHHHILDGSRGRAGSLSSSTGSSSPPATSETSVSPLHQPQVLMRKKGKIEFFGERIRQSCGANGIFARRVDYSAFNRLPRCKLNSYHIKMEDEGNHGNDETRAFILSKLASLQWSRVSCVLCKCMLKVYDKYPLVDGTFFLSPKKHVDLSVEVRVGDNRQYLSAVCVHCAHGITPAVCTFCNRTWDGSSLIIGTMYTYDIFAAMPCCVDRLKCNHCFRPQLPAPTNFSGFSREFSCKYCSRVDTHYVKLLSHTFHPPIDSMLEHQYYNRFLSTHFALDK